MFIIAVGKRKIYYSKLMNPKDQAHPSGPALVGTYMVHIDRDLCIGAATCAAIAPHTFNLDNDAKAIILDTAGSDDAATVLEAARACPVAAITLKDNDGHVVFP